MPTDERIFPGAAPLLPTANTSNSKHTPSRSKDNFLARHARLVLLSMASLSTLALLSFMYHSTTLIASLSTSAEDFVPYRKYHESEARLPQQQQHHGETKYLWIGNHLQSMYRSRTDERSGPWLTLYTKMPAGAMQCKSWS